MLTKLKEHWLISNYVWPIYQVLDATIISYNRHRVLRMAAALAYYTIFSLPAIIIIIVGLVGFFLGEAAVQGQVQSVLEEFLGSGAAQQVENAVKNIGSPKASWWATMLGFVFLVFVATGVFYTMQEALNIVFEVEPLRKRARLMEIVINRILSFGMILCVSFLLLCSILLNAILLQLSRYAKGHDSFILEHIPEDYVALENYLKYFTGYFLVFLNLGLSIFLIAVFFALIYKVLPAVKLSWRYIWIGAFFSSILFWVGQMLIGVYLNHANVISAYGAAGSLIMVLIWVYYSSQLVFLGAEFILALSRFKGKELKPKAYAKRLQRVGRK